MIDHARRFASNAHAGQKRKNSSTAYIVHPIRVAEILNEAGFSEALICAGFLHDVVEDTPYTFDDIEHEFGKDVRELVAAHTEDKNKSWMERKQQTIHTLSSAPLEVKALIVADKLDNLSSIQKDRKVYGENIWTNFNAGYDQQKWYYQSIADNMFKEIDHKSSPAFFTEYQKLVEQTFD